MMVWSRMSTFSFSAMAEAARSGRTLKPMMTASEALASRTSLSVIAPTPLLSTRIRTFSFDSFCSMSESTSAVPELSVLNKNGGHRTTAFVELRFEHRTDAGSCGIRLEIADIRNQQNHFEQQVEIGFGLGRNRHHDRVATPVFGKKTTVGKLL